MGDEHATLRRYMARLKNASGREVVQQVIAEMIAYFGGIRGFAVSWKAFMDRGQKQRRPSKGVFDSFLAIERLIELCGGQTEDEDAKQMRALYTDEELDADVERLFAKAAKQDMAVTIDRLREAGWQVIPPNSGDA